MNYHIRKVAVLGSGVMGSGIACHLANAGFQVLMLDMPNTDGKSRNERADQALKAAIKSKPAPLYKKAYQKRIATGNFEDDLDKISDCDWIIEVVVEKLEIKQSLFEKVEKYRKAGTLVSTNTSGIPIEMIADGRSEDFKAHFLGTHFFNPPRYLRLLEIIPGKATKQDVIDFFLHFGDIFLGKETVLCKDTPAFIANRIGVYAMSFIFQTAAELGLSPTAVDKLTGPAIGRPKTGTFRLGDLVGLDVAEKVLSGIQKNCPEDKLAQELELPDAYKTLTREGHYGNKSGQGFYKKTKERDENGRRVILEFDLQSKSYQPTQKVDLPSLKKSKQTEDLKKRLSLLLESDDKGGELLRKSFAALFAYSAARVPEIADDIYAIDNALKAGFGWKLGPFEYWDAIGLEKGIELCKSEGFPVAEWVEKLHESNKDSFYTIDNNQKQYFNLSNQSYKSAPGNEGIIDLNNYRGKAAVFKNDEVILHDIGDGVLCLEFTSKMNAIGEGILTGINKAIDIAESEGWNGIVIGNHADNFTVGANLMMIGMMAFQQQWPMLNQAVALFQNTTMRCRYSAIPVVAATQGYVFGGGCELSMHCDAVVAAAESYIGLVEVGVGLLPGGAGTKEMAIRTSDAFVEGGVQIPTLIKNFKTIALAEVATSAPEAFDKQYLNEKDEVILNVKRNIFAAKEKVLELAEDYVQPIKRSDITVLGQQGLASLYVAANGLYRGHYASEHDIKIAKKIAWVLCGGDLTGQQQVTEDYLIELEREAFLSLCGEPKTLERIQHMLEKNKPLRN